MAKIIPIKTKAIPIYGECGCGGDTFLLHLSDMSDDPDVIALECAKCRESVELEPSIVITCEMED